MDRAYSRLKGQHSLNHIVSAGSPPEPLILNEAMISQWLQEHRANYPSATETLKACMVNFSDFD